MDDNCGRLVRFVIRKIIHLERTAYKEKIDRFDKCDAVQPNDEGKDRVKIRPDRVKKG
jgi:hypothetical protein